MVLEGRRACHWFERVGSASPAEVAQVARLRPPTGGPARAHAGSDSRNKVNQLGQLGALVPARVAGSFGCVTRIIAAPACEHEQPRAHQHTPSINVLDLTGIAHVPPVRALR
jgi:hypothetical protein